MSEPLFHVSIIYLLFVGIITVLFRLIRKAFSNKIILLLYIFVLISPLFLYIPVELNTYLYGNEFKNVEIDTGFEQSTIYYKVFSIDAKEAKLFYVEGENGKRSFGTFYYFEKENGKWEFKEWGELMWTNLGGSASEFTVPPYF